MNNAFGMLASRFRILVGKMEQKATFVKDIVLTHAVLHNILRTHQGKPYRAPTLADAIPALQNEQVLYVPDDNYKNLY